MIHLSSDPTNGTRLQRALREMTILEEEGVDGVIIENYHGSTQDVEDVFTHLWEFLSKTKLIIGINILPNEYEQAIVLANKVGAKFVQLDHVAGSYNGGVSIFEPHLATCREEFPNIKILGGVWPKYYRPVKGSVLKDDIESGMKRADAIVVTGEGTGKVTPLDKIKEFRSLAGEFPIIIGAGLTTENVAEQLRFSDGAIVGSCFKPAGVTTQEINRELVRAFMDEVKKVRLKREYEKHMKSVTDNFISMLSDGRFYMPDYEIVNNEYVFSNTMTIGPAEEQHRDGDWKMSEIIAAWSVEKNKRAVEYLKENTMTYSAWLLKFKKC